MDKNIINYFNYKLKVLYPELVDIILINSYIGKVKLIFSNEKEWCGRIFSFTEIDYNKLTNKHTKKLVSGIDIDNIF